MDDVLRNDQLDQWDRDTFLHPSTHLAQHARGESATRIIRTASGVRPKSSLGPATYQQSRR